MGKIERWYDTDSFLPSLSQHAHHSIMVLFDMQVQEVLRRKVPSALEASVGVGFGIVDVVLFI